MGSQSEVGTTSSTEKSTYNDNDKENSTNSTLPQKHADKDDPESLDDDSLSIETHSIRDLEAGQTQNQELEALAIYDTNADMNLNMQAISREASRVSTIPPEEDPQFQRFTPREKQFYVLICAFSCFISPVSNMAFLPAIDNIAKDYHTTELVINITNAIFNVVMSVAPCLMSPLSDIYGRKIMLLLCAFGVTLSSGLTAASVNLAMFIVFRCLTALFGTAVFAIGGSVVGDIYIPTQRGNAMGWILIGSQVGPALGPVCGGIIVTYTSWRAIFGVIGGLSLINLLLIFFCMKETSRTNALAEMKLTNPEKKFVFVPFNPLKVIMALRFPNLILASTISCSLLYNMYSLLTPIRSVMDPRFNLTSPIYGSLFYLAPGMGYLIGSFFGGKYADYTTKKWIKKRNGKRVPEDRLKSTIFAHGFLQPAMLLIYGWALEKEKGGIALPVVAMFFVAFGQTITFPSLNAYCVDCLPQLKSDAIASNYFTRYIAGAVGTATCLIQVDNIGIGWTCTISAFVLWFSFGCSLILQTFGASLRNQAQKKYNESQAKSIAKAKAKEEAKRAKEEAKLQSKNEIV